MNDTLCSLGSSDHTDTPTAVFLCCPWYMGILKFDIVLVAGHPNDQKKNFSWEEFCGRAGAEGMSLFGYKVI